MRLDAAEERRRAYRALCEHEPSIPLFSRAFWLDAVSGPQAWDVALVQNGERIDAALPYSAVRRGRSLRIEMPSLTQTAGPWMRIAATRYSKRLAQEKDLMLALIDRLEAQCAFDSFKQRFHHAVTNWLPFYWRGYSQTTRYTYVIDDLRNLDAVWSETQANVRTDVRKARDRYGLTLEVAHDTRELLRLCSSTFARQEIESPYEPALVERVEAACRARDCARILLARDAQGRTHAAAYVVWDSSVAYHLMSGADPELRNSGAQSFLVWEAIRVAAGARRSFDFEGSMLESVERFVRAFGAKQVPYFAISKTRSLSLEARASAGELVKRARGELRTRYERLRAKHGSSPPER